ncbi:Aspartic peptidase [Artemisia annua]|uniref:Aspartic peptidase n=1 Tax=Artemisia annua TaxID=35608 RepID=A0A2U1Q6F8_ARTAN|nr:Aspartic peptidase [Artemisia annua]
MDLQRSINFYNDSCGNYPTNHAAHTDGGGEFGADVIKIESTNGKNILRNVSVPRFYFISGNSYLQVGLAIGVVRIAGFGRTGNAKNVQRVPNVAPFGACFSSMNISRTHWGPDVPSIDLVLHTKSVYRRISGANSMVKLQKNVLCLGFVEEPTEQRFRPRSSIVTATHWRTSNRGQSIII